MNLSPDGSTKRVSPTGTMVPERDTARDRRRSTTVQSRRQQHSLLCVVILTSTSCPASTRQSFARSTPHSAVLQSGRASCRERVCMYVSSSVVAVSSQQKNRHYNCTH